LLLLMHLHLGGLLLLSLIREDCCMLGHLHIEKLELLSDGQILDHVIVSEHFERHAKDCHEEQSLAHRAFVVVLRGRRSRRVHLEIAMQVVHTLSARQLHHLLGKDEDLRYFLVALEVVEGLKEVFVAAE